MLGLERYILCSFPNIVGSLMVPTLNTAFLVTMELSSSMPYLS
ncbi:putative membrane protein [Anaplasma phagocytophilum str. ApWI1]|uniref:Putative membrane protein n=3 Tax=Anaplasma phagocytophilum TaxID=948 RepID=A0A0F3NEY7_ANAPH|nr:putative membrane protein [Anaplasma phagocytophilum str. Webster]KJV64386.1 putative membrane protein [Anaplasma phagocytophilum str. ApMUC09]KJV66262.1 putative membrane protein [Anaplasma phagocytophilum str. ApNP]KJV83483.1 putative membrane protein [Anaplasma phagocytophilum str. HGE2]KJV84275.1 putative membrane protein [Anaplasma phagocytophilum str. ApWI1]KJV87298.1 putative membrane protein [Anaplasma phagocytophilum str. ApNYW]KJZ99793.1 putative membrane protein [Anaplasma phago